MLRRWGNYFFAFLQLAVLLPLNVYFGATGHMLNAVSALANLGFGGVNLYAARNF